MCHAARRDRPRRIVASRVALLAKTSETTYRPDIDGLRAVAVLAVVVFHAWPRLAPGGFAGVDVFFVISGFLITGIIYQNLERARFSFADFYTRRIRRIFPALTLVLAAVAALGFVVLPPAEYASLGKHIVAASTFMANLLLWRQIGYFNADATQKPLLHLWSLGVEEQFYLVWPALIVFAWRRHLGVGRMVAALLLASFAINVALIRTHPAAAFYLPVTRVWELAIGGLLALDESRVHGAQGAHMVEAVLSRFRFGSSAASAAGLLLLALSVVIINGSTPFPGWFAVLPCVGTALIIAAGPRAIANRALLSRRPLVYIGLISYPLYLWHWPLLVLGKLWYSAGVSDARLVPAIVALAFVLSVLTYELVERPIRTRAVPSLRLASWLAGAAAVPALFGITTAVTHGWPSRFSPEMRALLAYHYDFQTALRDGQCLLSRTQTTFAPECIDPRARIEHRPLLLLWGDSHAAMLFAGIAASPRSASLALGQLTSSACPPILGFDKRERPNCRMVNDAIRDSIRSLRPATVILAHDWPQSFGENAVAGLAGTVAFLRSAGVRRIVLVGPVPHWKSPLRTVLLHYMRSRELDTIPTRLAFGLDSAVVQIDGVLRRAAEDAGIVYVPAYDVFCSAAGCLTLTPSNGVDLTAFDDAHLSAGASRYLVTQQESQFFGPS